MTLRRLLWVGLGTAFLIFVIAGYAVFIYPKRAAETMVREALTDLPPGWTAKYAKLEYGLFKHQIVLDNLVLARDGASIEIAILALTGIEQDAARPGAQEIGEISVTGFSYHDDRQQVSFRTADAAEVAGDFKSAAHQILTGADPAAPLAIPVLITARRIRIDDFHSVSSERTDTLDRITVTDFGHGELASLGLNNWHVEKAGGDTGGLGTLRLTSFNTEGLRRLLDPANAATPGEIRSLLGHLDWTDLDFGSSERRIRLKSAKLEGLRGRPFSLEGQNLLAPDRALYAVLGAALTFDSLQADGLQLGEPDEAGGTTLQSAEVTGYDRGKVGKLVATRLESRDAAAQDDAEFAAMEVHDADLTPWIRRLPNAGSDEALFDPAKDIDKLAYLDLADLSVSHGPAAPLRIDSLHWETSYEEDKPTASTAVLKGGSLPVERLGLTAAQSTIFRDLQLSKLAIDLDAAIHWQLNERRAEIDNILLTVHGLGALGLAGSLQNIEPSQLLGPNYLSAIQKISLGHLTLHYADESLVGHVLAAKAQAVGKTTSRFRDDVIAQIDATANQLHDQPESATAILALAAAVKQPGDVAATISPPQPVELDSLWEMPLVAIPQKLGLHIVEH